MARHLSGRARPPSYDLLVGQHQQKIAKVLANDVMRNEPRHIIASGASGTGKSTIADIYGRSLLCDRPTLSGACGICEPCLAAAKDRNPDFKRIDCPNQGGPDDIGYVLTNSLAYQPIISRRRVVVFEEAQKLGLESQEKLLTILEAQKSNAVCIFTLISPDALIVPLRNRARLFELQAPDFHTSVDYLNQLAARQSIAIELDAVRLIAAFAGDYRKLAESLDTADAWSGDAPITVDCVRQSLLRDRSQGMLELLGFCAQGRLEEQLRALAAMNLSPAEKVGGIIEVLKHLLVRYVGPTRVRRDHDRLTLLLPDADCQEVVGYFSARASELGRTVPGLFDEMLEFWLNLPAIFDDNRLEAQLIRFHQLLTFSAADSDPELPERGAKREVAASQTSRAKRNWRTRDRQGLIDRRGEWLTLAQNQETYQAASFMAQIHGRTFNARFVVDHGRFGKASDEECAERVSGLLKQLRQSFFVPAVKRHGPAAELHRIAFHERGLDGGLRSTILLHLPQDIEADLHERLVRWAARTGDADAVELDVTHPVNAPAAMGRQWVLMRDLWGGLDPECVLDGLPVLDLLQVPVAQRRSLGAIACRRFNPSLSIGDEARNEAARQRMAPLSVWADRAWKSLFTGWELREHKDRTEESARRAARLEEIRRAYSSSDAALEHSVLQAALTKEQASWGIHPHDRPRKWRVWWEADCATAVASWTG